MRHICYYRNDLIDEQHKSQKVVTQREVNPKQVVPQIKEEKEQVIDTHTLACNVYCICA